LEKAEKEKSTYFAIHAQKRRERGQGVSGYWLEAEITRKPIVKGVEDI